MIRAALSIVPAILVVFGLFWILQSMIQVATKPPAMQASLHLVDFVRLKRERPLVKKERLKPKIIANQTVEQRALIQIDYRLNR